MRPRGEMLVGFYWNAGPCRLFLIKNHYWLQTKYAHLHVFAHHVLERLTGPLVAGSHKKIAELVEID